MRQTVTVVSVSGNSAKVTFDRPTACHGDCSHCAGGCSSLAAKEQVIVTAENLIGAKPGDRVTIESAAKSVFSAILLVYALPIILFFCGYFIGEMLSTSGSLLGILGFFLGLGAAVLVSRWKTKTGKEIQFQIVGFAQ